MTFILGSLSRKCVDGNATVKFDIWFSRFKKLNLSNPNDCVFVLVWNLVLHWEYTTPNFKAGNRDFIPFSKVSHT